MKKHFLHSINILIFLQLTTIALGQSFKVESIEILDPEGEVFLIKGTNVNGPHWPWDRSTVGDENLIVDVWKFNTVRVNAFPSLQGIFPDHNTDLDAIVETFTSQNVVTIIENHDFTGEFPTASEQEELENWWRDLAERYKDNTYVWFNIANEPGPSRQPLSEQWKTFHEAVVKVIREEVQAENIIVLDGNAFGQEKGYEEPEESGIHTYGPYFVENYSNITFSLHLYNAWHYGRDRLEQFIDDAHASGLSMHIGEYGSAKSYIRGVTKDMFQVLLPKGIGRIVWQWDGVDSHKLTEGSGGWAIDKTNGDKPTNLSYVGNLVWLDNHGMLTLDSEAFAMQGPWILNGSFEEEELDFWNAFGNNAVVEGTAQAHDGVKAFQVPSGNSGGAVQPLYLLPDSTYVFSAWGKSSSSSPPNDVGIQYRTPETGEQVQHVLSFDGDAWHKKSLEFTLPSDLYDLSVFIYRADGGDAFYVDKLELFLTGEVTGLPDVLQKVAVFPNPFQDAFQLHHYFADARNLQLRLHDMLGRSFEPESYSIEQGMLNVNTPNLQKGIYLLSIWDGDQVTRMKVLKE